MSDFFEVIHVWTFDGFFSRDEIFERGPLSARKSAVVTVGERDYANRKITVITLSKGEDILTLEPYESVMRKLN